MLPFARRIDFEIFQALLNRFEEWRCYRRLAHLRQGLHDPVKDSGCTTYFLIGGGDGIQEGVCYSILSTIQGTEGPGEPQFFPGAFLGAFDLLMQQGY